MYYRTPGAWELKLDFSMKPLDRPSQLREEARETWDYFLTEQVVYGSHLGEAEAVASLGYLEQYVHSEIWFECTLWIAPLRQAYAARMIFEYLNADLADSLYCSDVLAPGKRNVDSMLVSVPEFVENSEVVGAGIPTVGWLKFYDSGDGIGQNVVDERPEMVDAPLA